MRASILALICLAWIHSTPVAACSCFPTPSERDWDVARAYHRADVVFFGEATDVRELTPARETAIAGEVVRGLSEETVFSVLRSWKGGLSPQAIVWTVTVGASCGIRFEQGNRYVIYGRYLDNGIMTTSSCARNASGALADEHVGILEEIVSDPEAMRRALAGAAQESVEWYLVGRFGHPPEESGDLQAVATELKEAAEREPDALLREALWQEYRRYSELAEQQR